MSGCQRKTTGIFMLLTWDQNNSNCFPAGEMLFVPLCSGSGCRFLQTFQCASWSCGLVGGGKSLVNLPPFKMALL